MILDPYPVFELEPTLEALEGGDAKTALARLNALDNPNKYRLLRRLLQDMQP